MKWQEVRSQDDANYLMRAAEQFHDWYLAGFNYDPLASAADDSKSLSRFTSDINALTVLLRYCSKDKRGEWPEIELQLSSVYKMDFGKLRDPDPFWECWLERLDGGGSVGVR